MDRREFLQSLAMLTAGAALPLPGLALQRPAWSIGFEGINDDPPPLALQLEGRFPTDCFGTLYRNGPALYERAGQRYQHWFDPDGLVQAYSIGEKSVEHRGRFVRTQKYLREEEAGRFLYGGAGTRFPDERPVRNNNTGNVANINIQAHNGQLLALWEAGSAYRIDPETLETRGILDWSEALTNAPFSAHPRFDDEGVLWNIGSVSFADRPQLILYHVSRSGKLLKSRIVPMDFAGYLHDFVLTPRYLLVLNSSAVMGAGETFVDRMHWESDRASQLLVFDKEDFSLVGKFDIDPCFVFHFGNGWEEGNRLRFTACAHANMNIVNPGMFRLVQGADGPYHAGPELVEYAIDLSAKRVSRRGLGVDMEFPGYNTRNPYAPQAISGVTGHADSASGLASAVLRIDARSGERERFDYGDGVIVEEPLLVEGRNGAWLLHSFLDYRRKRSGIAVLRCGALADGPVAMATMPRYMPLGFHGCFLRNARPS